MSLVGMHQWKMRSKERVFLSGGKTKRRDITMKKEKFKIIEDGMKLYNWLVFIFILNTLLNNEIKFICR